MVEAQRTLQIPRRLTRADYCRIRPKLVALFRSRGLASGLIDDLVQETFLHACQSLDRFKGHSEIDTWVVSIGKNVYLHFLRHKKAIKRQAVEVSLEPPGETTSGDGPSLDSPEDMTRRSEQQELLQRVQGEIAALPEELRQPLLLQVQGYSYDEIAQLLRLTRSTVTDRIFRARKTLRKLFPRD